MKRFIIFRHLALVVIFCTLFNILALMPTPARAAEVRSIIFPVLGDVYYSDDFGDPRSDHTHAGNDIMAPKMRPLVAAVDGVVEWVSYPEAEWGYMISLRDSDGYKYWYIHVNNDNPGTDDDQGGGFHAYAPDITSGAKVAKGQLIGWVGDSGNAEDTGSHLHFEIHTPDGTPFDPFESLQAATTIATPAEEPKQANEILPYKNFQGGASIAIGYFGAQAEIITGAGEGGGPHVRIFKSNGKAIANFMAFDVNFRGGVDLATGDVNGDGIDEIVVGAGPGAEPQVRIFDAKGEIIGSFMAYTKVFKGGLRVAVGDINNDGKDEIITGAGPGGNPKVRIFKASGKVISGFIAYDPTFKGGVDVAVKPATSTSPARIVTSPLSNGGPQIRTFDTHGKPKTSFFAYDVNYRGGVKIAVTNINQTTGSFRIVTVPAYDSAPLIRIFSSVGKQTGSATAFEPWWQGGYEIAATDEGTIYVSATGRRASIRIANLKN